ncbi:MAG: UDP-N-acetylmuramate dehydrogenase [Lachnospiraceae bacterium]|nr:UDP-N-acetylmuramate dehydrogenase [Lachnospiraceae bacterium]
MKKAMVESEMLEILQKLLGTERVWAQEPMKKHTTFRVGGCARYLVEPKDALQLSAVVNACRAENMPYYVVGNGSNLLVSDSGYDGVIIHLFKNMSGIRTEGNHMILQAGALLVRAASTACREGLSGLEFASGIPGTVGGALVMNAGAYGGEMKDVVSRVTVLTPEGETREYTKEQMAFGYRRSRLTEEAGIVLETEFSLQPGRTEEIRARMEELKEKRVSRQPLEYASAGSTFKRPKGYFAGKLIEDAGLRGYRIGDAQVSEKHCGFVINRGNATASEIAEVIRQVQERVYAHSGVRLQTEVKLLGWE